MANAAIGEVICACEGVLARSGVVPGQARENGLDPLAVADLRYKGAMKIAVAADHAGFPLKANVIAVIERRGHEVLDLGTHSTEPVDYPDLAVALGTAIQRGTVERGVLLCGSGVGASVAASKLRGVRAAVCHDTYSAHQGVEHDDMNVLALGARIIGPELIAELVSAFLAARFTNEERHVRRLAKIAALEESRA